MPFSLFHSNSYIPPWSFFARKILREAATSWYTDAAGFPSLLGSRVRPLGHQIYVALKVLGDRTQRFLLADEVGLGKTIETGLILQALWHHRPDLSVLIITPGAMVQQWWREIYLRFGARVFTYIDAQHIPSREMDRRLESSCLITSTSALHQNPRLRKSITKKTWQTLVIDEAHHLDFKNPLYKWIRNLSSRADHVLALSATPSRRKISGLASLMAIILPDEYDPSDENQISLRISSREKIWTAIDQTSQLLSAADSNLNELDKEDIQFIIDGWDKELREDSRIESWLTEASKLSPSKAIEKLWMVLAYARERWRLDHRIIRTRRRTLMVLNEKFSKRELESEIRYEASAGELEIARLLNFLPPSVTDGQRTWCEILHRGALSTPSIFKKMLNARLLAIKEKRPHEEKGFAAAWESDPGPAEEAELIGLAPINCPALTNPISPSQYAEMEWLNRALAASEAWEKADGDIPSRYLAAMEWLVEKAREDTNRRFLVFAQEKDIVDQFADILVKNTELEVRKFHHGMSESELEDSALEFTRGKKVKVLISDELGGEGRNFQVAWGILHLDLPVSPMRIEQRIGRADRLGRDPSKSVLSAVVIGPSDFENFLYQIHKDVFLVFNESIGGLEYIIPELVTKIRKAISNAEFKDQSLIETFQGIVNSTRDEEDDVFQTGLDTAKADLNRGSQLAKLIADEQFHATAPVHWLKALGIQVREDGKGKSRVSFETDWLEVPIPGINSGTEFRATWYRNKALKDESLQYLGPGHRIVDGAYSLLDTSNFGRICVFGRSLGPLHKNSWYAIALFVVELPEDNISSPAGLIARARSEVGRDTHLAILRLDQSTNQWVRETNSKLIQQLEQPFKGRSGDEDLWDKRESLFKNNIFGENLQITLENIISELSTDYEAVGIDAAKTIAKLWTEELAYYDALIESQDQNEVSRGTRERDLRLQILDQVRSLRPKLDALAFVVGI